MLGAIATKASDAWQSINHLGTGSAKDPLRSSYPPGSLSGKVVRVAPEQFEQLSVKFQTPLPTSLQIEGQDTGLNNTTHIVAGLVGAAAVIGGAFGAIYAVELWRRCCPSKKVPYTPMELQTNAGAEIVSEESTVIEIPQPQSTPTSPN